MYRLCNCGRLGHEPHSCLPAVTQETGKLTSCWDQTASTQTLASSSLPKSNSDCSLCSCAWQRGATRVTKANAGMAAAIIPLAPHHHSLSSVKDLSSSSSTIGCSDQSVSAPVSTSSPVVYLAHPEEIASSPCSSYPLAHRGSALLSCQAKLNSPGQSSILPAGKAAEQQLVNPNAQKTVFSTICQASLSTDASTRRPQYPPTCTPCFDHQVSPAALQALRPDTQLSNPGFEYITTRSSQGFASAPSFTSKTSSSDLSAPGISGPFQCPSSLAMSYSMQNPLGHSSPMHRGKGMPLVNMSACQDQGMSYPQHIPCLDDYHSLWSSTGSPQIYPDQQHAALSAINAQIPSGGMPWPAAAQSQHAGQTTSRGLGRTSASNMLLSNHAQLHCSPVLEVRSGTQTLSQQALIPESTQPLVSHAECSCCVCKPDSDNYILVPGVKAVSNPKMLAGKKRKPAGWGKKRSGGRGSSPRSHRTSTAASSPQSGGFPSGPLSIPLAGGHAATATHHKAPSVTAGTRSGTHTDHSHLWARDSSCHTASHSSQQENQDDMEASSATSQSPQPPEPTLPEGQAIVALVFVIDRHCHRLFVYCCPQSQSLPCEFCVRQA